MLSTCLILASLAPAEAAPPPPTLRELCIRAPHVVLARPADPHSPTRFTVLAVLRGKDLRAGEKLTPMGVTAKQVQSFDEVDPRTRAPRPRKVGLALLFLEPARSNSEHSSYRVVQAGFRLSTDDDRVLTPSTEKGGGPQVVPGVRWAALVETVRSDLAAVDRLRAARRLARPAHRVRALTDWVQRRRGELAQLPSPSPGDLSPSGWYELATEVFDWIFEDATPAEALAAARLYASLNRGEVPRLKSPAFATTDGRKLLLETALDAKHSSAERQQALQLLAAPITLAKADDAERAALAEKLRGALSVKDDGFQIQAARAVVALIQGDGKKEANVQTVNALAGAYRAAEPGPCRDELAWALCRVASAEQYRELTSNPPGVCVRLSEFAHEGNEVTFFLDLRTGRAEVCGQPTLVIEKLGAAGVVAETKKLPLAVLNLERPWTDGVADSSLAVRLDLPKLIVLPVANPRGRNKPAPAVYRFRVEGTVGKGSERRTWRSEPRKITVSPAPPGERF